MGRLFSADYWCNCCDRRFNKIVDFDSRKDPQPCPKCDTLGENVIAAPRPLRASYHDGVRRPGFKDAAEASELEAASFDVPVEQRTEINREIDRLRSTDPRQPKEGS